MRFPDVILFLPPYSYHIDKICFIFEKLRNPFGISCIPSFFKSQGNFIRCKGYLHKITLLKLSRIQPYRYPIVRHYQSSSASSSSLSTLPPRFSSFALALASLRACLLSFLVIFSIASSGAASEGSASSSGSGGSGKYRY